MTRRVDALLDALQSDEPADLAIERSAGMAEVKIGPQPIARVDERREELVVYAPADARPKLQAEYPRARPDPAGVAFDLSNEKLTRRPDCTSCDAEQRSRSVAQRRHS